MQEISTSDEIYSSPACSGYCAACGKEHMLGHGMARDYCLELMRELDEKKRIDLSASDQNADPRFSTDYLFGKARGQMFGVMVYRDTNETVGALRGFSGQYNGLWEVDGWVPPLFDVQEFENISKDTERTIKEHGRRIEQLQHDDSSRQKLIRIRKSLSRNLMKEIHSLYECTNFRGETKSLDEVFHGDKGIPTGTGDCCAPKLLNYAAKNSLTPLGLAEFYWGRANKSATRHHGRFYQSCESKCKPILGFMLCGLEEV